jgi:hypothetical protein
MHVGLELSRRAATSKAEKAAGLSVSISERLYSNRYLIKRLPSFDRAFEPSRKDSRQTGVGVTPTVERGGRWAIKTQIVRSPQWLLMEHPTLLQFAGA